MTKALGCVAVVVAVSIIGCGGNSGTTSTASTSGSAASASSGSQAQIFTLQLAPTSVTLVPGGGAQSIAVLASGSIPANNQVVVTLGPLPAGVTATPSTLSLAAAKLGQFSLSASSAAAAATANISVKGVMGTTTESASAAVTVSAAQPAPEPVSTPTNPVSPVPVTPPVTSLPYPSAALSATAYNFGNDLVGNPLVQQVAVLTNTGSAPLTFNPALTGDPSFTLVANSNSSVGSCTQQLAIGASCSLSVQYSPTQASAPTAQAASLNLNIANVTANTPEAVALTGTAYTLPVGTVSPTNNPQVALYTMTLPFPGSVTVNFGKDTNYGLKTWSQSTATTGGQVSIFVAGMLASTAYHMQAAVAFTNGINTTDSDHTFTTGAVPANMQINLTATTTPGMTPQPGVEMINPVLGSPSGVLITDLAGNTLWTYHDPGNTTLNFIDGVKTLPNGDLLMVTGPTSTAPLAGPVNTQAINEIREVNLGGDTVREITVNDLNSELAAASCAECHVTLGVFHHDVEVLPNGHILVLGSTNMSLSGTTTPALTNAPAQTVLGDVIVDLDQNLQPVWAWNTFNHLDPNRHPYSFPDWTHSNALVYSKDDGNFILSMRHQNWVIKINYKDGAGDGSIVWHLGEGGDFTLQGGTDPTDWQYAQHFPAYFGSSTAGVFTLGVMDNGDDRIFPAGVTCGTTGNPPCLYSTIPIWQIDEGAKTATSVFPTSVAA